MRSAALVLIWALGTAQALLYGLFHEPGSSTNCTFRSIDLTTGANNTIATEVPVCAGLTSTYPSFSAASASQLFVAIEGARDAYFISPSGKVTRGAAMANNESDPLVGAAYIAPAFLVVTQYGVWDASVAGGAPTLVAAYAGWSSAVVTSAGTDLVLVANAEGNQIAVVDIPARSTRTSLKGISRPMDVAVSRGIIYEMAGYQLYTLPLTGGTPRPLMSLPDGPGFPRVNGFVSPTTWYFADFLNLYTINVETKHVVQVPGSFVGAPSCVGFPRALA
jgi:hypothetical protein